MRSGEVGRRVAPPARFIETRSRPRVLAAIRRGFAFYVAFPKSSMLPSYFSFFLFPSSFLNRPF